jgi:hypothetical protein
MHVSTDDANGLCSRSASCRDQTGPDAGLASSGRDEFFPLDLFESSRLLFDLSMKNAFRVMHCSLPCHDAAKNNGDDAA